MKSKINKEQYFKEYYQKNKDKMKDNSRKSYLKKKGVDTDLKFEYKSGSFLLSFN